MPSAVLFATGYGANLGTIQALAGPEDVVFSDQLNHASIVDGSRLSRARVEVFAHRDVSDLASRLRAGRGSRRRFVITDSLFSMDGDFAPLTELRRLCTEFDAALIVDEAHSLGVFGPRGRGLCAELDVTPDVLMGTLGKAFGAAGAFVAATPSVCRVIENRARSYVFSTAPMPALAACAIAACDLVEAGDQARAHLHGLAARLRSELRALGYNVPEGTSQIVPVIIGDPRQTMSLSQRLLERGVFAHGVRPPTVPPGTSRLRLAPIATHTHEHIDRVIEAFRALA